MTSGRSEIAGCFLGCLGKRSEIGGQHHATETPRASEQAAAIRQPLHGLQPITEAVHLDSGDRVNGGEALVVGGEHPDVHARFLFCVCKVKKKWRDVIPRIARERRGQMKHAHVS